MSTLLERTRKINRVLQRFHNVDYKEMATVLSNVIDANIYIVDTTGLIYGCAFLDDFECDVMLEHMLFSFYSHLQNPKNMYNQYY